MPLDYANATGPKIKVALKRVRTPGSDGAPLVVNFGGPGAGAIDGFEEFVAGLPLSIRRRYELIAMDPRGTGRSARVDCLGARGLDRYFSGHLSDSRFATACERRTGKLLQHVGTDDAARDLDRVRRVLGSPDLNFLGYSYGTELGARYLALFPEWAGRFVLDGPLPPELDSLPRARDQSLAYDRSVNAFLHFCRHRHTCTAPPTRDAAALRAYIDGLAARPLKVRKDSGGASVKSDEAEAAVDQAMYAGESAWPDLADALQAAVEHRDGTRLRRLAGESADDDGTEAQIAIECADHGPAAATEKQFTALERELRAQAPYSAFVFAWQSSACRYLPTQRPATVQTRAPLRTRPLVIGTIGDPITPYVWAEQLAATVDGRLLTVAGHAHTAFPGNGRCVDGTVERYLTGKLTEAPLHRCTPPSVRVVRSYG